MNRLSLMQRLSRWGAVAASACAESSATAYAASALMHVVVLGGALILAPWGNSGVGFSVAQGNGGAGEHASPLGSAGGSETTEVIRFELLKPRAVVGGHLPVEEKPAASEPVIVTDSRPVATDGAVLEASVMPLKVQPQMGAMARYERPNVKEDASQIPDVAPKELPRREETAETVPEEAEPVPAKMARRELLETTERGIVRVELPEAEEVNGRGVTGGGTGAGIGEGNGGGRGLAGGNADSLPRRGPANPAPPYPPDALLAGVEAVVILRVQISAEGTVSSATIVKSSGWKSMDDSALTTIRRWHFEPARRAGLPISIELNLPVEFFLRRS